MLFVSAINNKHYQVETVSLKRRVNKTARRPIVYAGPGRTSCIDPSLLGDSEAVYAANVLTCSREVCVNFFRRSVTTDTRPSRPTREIPPEIRPKPSQRTWKQVRMVHPYTQRLTRDWTGDRERMQMPHTGERTD